MSIFGFGKKPNKQQENVYQQPVQQPVEQPVQQPVDTTPRPLGQAIQNSEGFWEQDYEIWNGRAWVVEKYIHNGVDWVKAPVKKLDLTKNIPNTAAGINLQKSVVSLDKSLVNLTKKTGINFAGHQAKVAVVMDYSGSMGSLYRSGAVQEVLTRLMPLALRFDDNGELDVWLFNSGYKRIDSMELSNFETFVRNVVEKSGFRMGTTSYAPVLEDVLRKYFVEDTVSSHIPTFVIFITDGSNDDKRATNEIIKKSSYENVFFQFVGIGDERFEYLEKLDDLTGRPVDNTGFIKVEDMAKLNDEELYNLLLSQYPDWLKVKGIN